MAISLPQYKQQVQPVADTTALKRDPNLEAKRIQAEGAADASKLDTFANVAKVGAQLAFQYRDTHNQSEKANYSIERQAMLEAYKDEISIINDEDELARAKDKYLKQVESVKNKYIDNIYGNKAKRQIDALDAEFKGKLDLLDTNRAFTIETDRLANTQFEYRAAAENGILLDNPNTGQKFQPVFKQEVDFKSGDFIDVLDESGQPIIEKTALQVQDEYATNELLRLGKITPQSAADRKITFGQNSTYKGYRNLIDTDIDAFVENFDPTKISQDQRVAIEGYYIQEVRNIENKVFRTQSTSYNDVLTKIGRNQIDVIGITDLANQTVNFNGKEVSVLGDDYKNLAIALVEQRVTESIQQNNKEYSKINSMIDELDPNSFSMSDVNKIYSLMYDIEDGQPVAKFPLEQIQTFADNIALATGNNFFAVDPTGANRFDFQLTPDQKSTYKEILTLPRQFFFLDRPDIKLPKNLTVGFAIEGTKKANFAFNNMLKGKKDPTLGKVLNLKEFREVYIEPLKADIASAEAYNSNPPTTSVDDFIIGQEYTDPVTGAVAIYKGLGDDGIPVFEDVVPTETRSYQEILQDASDSIENRRMKLYKVKPDAFRVQKEMLGVVRKDSPISYDIYHPDIQRGNPFTINDVKVIEIPNNAIIEAINGNLFRWNIEWDKKQQDLAFRYGTDEKGTPNRK